MRALFVLITLAVSAPALACGGISMDLPDADVRDVLRMLADHGKLELRMDDDVTGTITVKVKNRPAAAVWAEVARLGKLEVRREGKVVFVSRAQDEPKVTPPVKDWRGRC